MATEEEVFKYVMQVEGEEKLKTAAAAAQLAEQKFRALYEQLGAGDARTKAAAASLVDLQRGLQTAQASSRDLGRATLEGSRAFEDLQYGIGGVLNNLPGLVASLGGSAGLAGVVSLVAVGAKILYDHWNDLGALFGQGHTKTEAERMEELGKKTEKTADETARLLKYEQERAAIKAQETTPTDRQSAQAKAVNEAIVNAPVAEVDRAIRNIHGKTLANGRDQGEVDEAARLSAMVNGVEERRKAGKEDDPGTIDNARARLDELAAKEEKRIADWIREYRGKVATEAGALKAFTEDLKKTGQLPGLVKKLEEAAITPEQKEADKENSDKDDQAIQAEEAARQDDKFLRKLRKDRAEKADKEASAKDDQDIAGEASGRDTDKFLRKLRKDRAEKADKENSDKDDQAIQAEEDSRQTDKFLKGLRQERRQKAVKDANKQAPGLDDLIAAQLKAAGNSDQAAAALRGGLSGRFGAEAAGDLVEGQRGKVQEELMSEWVQGPERESRTSQVIGSEGLASSIQQAVGGNDTQKQQLEQLQRQTLLLQAIASGGGPGRAVGFAANGQLQVT